MTILFHSLPLRKEKPLTIKKFQSGVVNLKVVQVNGIILGMTTKGLEQGRFHCNRFYEKHDQVDKDNLYEFRSLLECLVKVGYITKEECDAELDWLQRYQHLQRLEQCKRDLIYLFRNPEFVKYLETTREKLPEWLTLPKGIDKEFALALVKLKKIVDDQELEDKD